MKNEDASLDPFHHKSQNQRILTNQLERSCDSVWQVDPERILAYKPFNLHYYGWIPFPFRRNFRGTVFSEFYIYIQGAFLTGYMMSLHLTGFGVPQEHLRVFVALLGTLRVGALINLSTLITFILALFVTLMIQRWFDIRALYFKIRATTIDVCMMLSQIASKNDRAMHRAQVELTRLLNLGHLLLLIKADSETLQFQKSMGAKAVMKKLSKIYSTKPLDLQEEDEDHQDSSFFPWSKRMREVSFQDLYSQGLVNQDEWNLIIQGEENGCHGFAIVYSWTQDLLMKSAKINSMKKNPETFSILTNRVNLISENASSLLASIGSQMAYPYAQLVSFVVHVYLVVLTTWLGAFLHSGEAGETFTGTVSSKIEVEARGHDNDLTQDTWTVFWCYLYLNSANFFFQGLLNLHEVLDNPFGSHCVKFPLKSNTIEVINMTRALLTSNTTQLPSTLIEAIDKQDVDPLSTH